MQIKQRGTRTDACLDSTEKTLLCSTTTSYWEYRSYPDKIQASYWEYRPKYKLARILWDFLGKYFLWVLMDHH